MKTVKLSDFLTDDEIRLAIKLYENKAILSYAKEVMEQITRPNIARINESLGQMNNPMYLAYAIEYAMIRGENGVRLFERS